MDRASASEVISDVKEIYCRCELRFEHTKQTQEMCEKLRSDEPQVLPKSTTDKLSSKWEKPLFFLSEKGVKETKAGAALRLVEESDESETDRHCVAEISMLNSDYGIFVTDRSARAYPKQEFELNSEDIPPHVKTWLRSKSQMENTGINKVYVWETDLDEAKFIVYAGHSVSFHAASITKNGNVQELATLALEAADEKYYPSIGGVYKIKGKLYTHVVGHTGYSNGLLQFSDEVWHLAKKLNCDEIRRYSVRYKGKIKKTYQERQSVKPAPLKNCKQECESMNQRRELKQGMSLQGCYDALCK